MKIFSPILKGTTTMSQGTTNLSGSFTGSLLGTAATASYADNFTVGGTLTAQTINVQTITSSIEFNTGSTRNGALSTNTHQFTGSVSITGSAAALLNVNNGVLYVSASGNVGIGTTTLSFSTNYTALNINGTTGSEIYLKASNVDYGYIYANSSAVVIATQTAIPLNLQTNATTRLTITSAGNVGIGTTSPSSKLHAVITGTSFTPTATGQIGGNIANRVHIQSNEPGIMLSSDANGSGSPTGTQTYQLGLQIGVYTTNDIRSQIYFGNSLLSFVYSGDQGSSTSERMRISTNGSIGAPNGTNIYNASDIRLKKNISTTTYGLNTISALNPVKFNWVDGFEPTEDGKDMLGFVAQEVQTVIPEAIESFGGNSITVGDTIIENPLRVNEKFIIPVLVKAIQELKSENDTLKEILQRNNIQ
jgi:hypothetical protein